LLVELVDGQGLAVGSCPVAQAHRAAGQLHRAFSVLLFDDSGQVLLQQRAAVKTRFPMLWSNTCCGHPAPGQPVLTAAAARLTEELGVVAELAEVGTYRYRADDPATGRVEDEWDHVLIGQLKGDRSPRPDPDEVAALAWVRPQALHAALTTKPGHYTPWLAGVLAVAIKAQDGGYSAATDQSH
jgi:isopentenyl-diphosphate delta-isomerase